MYFSDDDEEIIEFLNTPYFSRRVTKRTDLFSSYRDDEFIKRFRLTKNTTTMLLYKIEPQLKSETNRLVQCSRM